MKYAKKGYYSDRLKKKSIVVIALKTPITKSMWCPPGILILLKNGCLKLFGEV